MTESEIKEKVEIFAGELQRFPAEKDFISHGKKQLLTALRNKGLRLTELEKVSRQKSNRTRAPLNFWSEKQIMIVLESIMKTLGRFPTKSEIAKMGYGGMLSAMFKSDKKSIYDYQKLFGLTPATKPKKYWNDLQNLKSELLKIINDSRNSFPSLLKIEMLLGSAAKKAVLQHGGIVKVAELMGYNYTPRKTYRTSDGHFVHSINEFLFDEFLFANGIPHEVGGKICENRNYRYDFKIEDNYIEIWGYEKNKLSEISIDYNKKREAKESLYSELNLKLISIEGTIFKSFKDELSQKFTSILASMNLNGKYEKKHFFSVKESLSRLRTFDESSVCEELNEITKSTGSFPTLNYLRKMKAYSLIEAIEELGGITYIANKMGLKRNRKQKWTKDKVFNRLIEITNKIGEFPKQKYLIETGERGLLQQMYKYGCKKELKQICEKRMQTWKECQ